jgi:Helix-turn-helix domain
MDKIFCSKKSAAQMLDCSVRTVENLISTKQLASRRLGRRRMVLVSSLMGLAKRDTPVITGTKPQGHKEENRS